MASPGPSPAQSVVDVLDRYLAMVARELEQADHEIGVVLADAPWLNGSRRDAVVSWRSAIRAALDVLAALPAPARPTAEQIECLETLLATLADSEGGYAAQQYRALEVLLTAVTGKDTL